MARMDMGTLQEIECAAQVGAPDALFRLGIAYSTGREVTTDLVSAHKWFNLAALRGNREALIYRKEIAMEMSGAQIAEAQRQARAWLRSN